MTLLQKESELQEIVQLVGPDALPEAEKLVLETTRMLREDFLQQSAFGDTDAYCPFDKQLAMLQVILDFYDDALDSVKRGVTVAQILELPHKNEIARLKEWPVERAGKEYQQLSETIKSDIAMLEVV